jgi:phospholipase C
VWNLLEQHELRRRNRRVVIPEPGQRPLSGLPAGTDLLPQIKHIVVLMMENHSYDNYLGMLTGRGEGMPLDRRGQPTTANPDAAGNSIPSYHLPLTAQVPEIPCQSWHASHLQWHEGKMDGFVTATQEVEPGGNPAVAMGYWTENDLPFYYGLARTFPLADHWFSSCLGPTFPNRRFLISGTAHGLIDDLPFHLVDYPQAGTIFDLLSKHDISWVNYRPVAAEKTRLRRAASYRRHMLRRRAGLLGGRMKKNVSQGLKDLQFTADLYPLGIGRSVQHVDSHEDFFRSADDGTLPAFSIVDPDFDSFSEENPQDVQKGESFAAEVINRVMHGKGWPETLLIWTYDENGGYYDHVAPPEAVPPDDLEGRGMADHPVWLQAIHRLLFPHHVKDATTTDEDSLRYDRYGFRVPAVIVSPYARRDCVLPDVFDHTSVLKLVEEKWNLPSLTRRDAAALSPLGALDLAAPPPFLEPPTLPAPALAWGSW